MKIILNPSEIKESAVLAIGNFDGVHLGHKYLLGKAKEISIKKKLPLAVMTFEPHPLHIFRRDLIPARITDMKAKLKLLEREGVQVCYVMKFNYKFSEILAKDFIEKFLQSSHVVTGYDFLFGYQRGGNSEMLKEFLGSNYTQVAAKGIDGQIFSSSSIRVLLKDGKIAEVNKILGYEYLISGRVVGGSKSATNLGFATANLRVKSSLVRPLYGVYAVNTNYGYGVANWGKRPTLDGETEFLEVHIFDFAQDIYGKKLDVKFLEFIREEQKFENLEKLREQIAYDIKNAKEITNNFIPRAAV